MAPRHVRPINPPPPKAPSPPILWWYGAGIAGVILILSILSVGGGNKSAPPTPQKFVNVEQVPTSPPPRQQPPPPLLPPPTPPDRVSKETKREAEDAVKASQRAANEGRYQTAEEKARQAQLLDPTSAAKQLERERIEAFDKALASQRSTLPAETPRSIPAGRRVIVAPVENTSGASVSTEAARSSIEQFMQKVSGVVVISRQEFEQSAAKSLLGTDGVVVRATIASARTRTPPPDFGDGTKLAVTEATVRLELVSVYGTAIASHESSGKSTAFGNEGKDSAGQRQKAIDDAVKRAFENASFTANFSSQSK